MTNARPQENLSTSRGTKVTYGVMGGIATGVFLGDLVTPFQVVGDIYLGLLQMTVLPYVVVSLMAKIGGLALPQAKRLAGRAGLVLVALWLISVVTVVALPLSLPEWNAGSFYSASLIERPQEFDFLGLYLPTNPFHSLANNVVPAAVLFSICVGVALIQVPDKERVVTPLEIAGQSLGRISDFVVRLAPWGTFALAAGAAGRISPSELGRLSGFVSSYTVGTLLLTFAVLPGLVAAITPFRLGAILARFREPGLTAFATAKLFAVLPMIIAAAKRTLAEGGVPEQEAARTPDVLIPLAYPFPGAGKILALFFLPFAAWFIGRPLDLGDYPALMSVGVLSFFGSPIAAVPFLLDFLQLPSDLFPLFLIAGIWTTRLGDVLGAMHLLCFTLICSAWNAALLRLRPERLLLWGAVTVGLGAIALGANYATVRAALAREKPASHLIARLDLLQELAEIEEDPDPKPNPVRLLPDETRLERIRRSGELRVGYQPERVPFCYRNAGGKIVGLDIDLVQRLAADLGVGLTLVPYESDGLAASFLEDHFDVAVGGRPSSIDSFGRLHESGAYMDLHVAAVVLDHRVREFRSLKAIREIEHLRIGVVSTGYLARTRRHVIPSAEIVQLPSKEAFLLGEVPDVDMLLTTAEVGAVITMLYPDYSVVRPREMRARIPIVFAMPIDARDLDRLVDTWIELKREDGTIDELHAHWIRGEQLRQQAPRWSVVRNVLAWVD